MADIVFANRVVESVKNKLRTRFLGENLSDEQRYFLGLICPGARANSETEPNVGTSVAGNVAADAALVFNKRCLSISVIKYPPAWNSSDDGSNGFKLWIAARGEWV